MPKLSVTELTNLKDAYEFTSRDEAEEALRKNGTLKKGTVIFSPYITHVASTDSQHIDLDKNERERGFYMWDGDKWVRYDTDEGNRIAEHS
jgi:hypothetical protein